MKSAPITTARVDLKSGEFPARQWRERELHEAPAQVRHDHFQPEVLKPPVLDEAKVTLIEHDSRIGPTGRSVIAMTDHREAEIEFWEAHADMLTREERSKLARGHATAVLRPIPSNWQKGDRVFVASNVEAEVHGIEETHRGYRTTFRIVDFRPLLPKRTVGGGSRPKTDEDGYPAELTEGEKERARVDGAYTRSAALAVPETDDELDDKLRERLHAEASMTRALSQSRQRKQLTQIQLEENLNEARKKHRRSTVRHLERRLTSLRSKQERSAA